MSGNGPMALAVESGKIEGLVINMVRQGCIIQGRAILEEVGLPATDVLINFVCEGEAVRETARTDNLGQFRLSNAPMNSECFLEASSLDGNILARTDPFNTEQKKQIYKDITIPKVQSVNPGIASDVFNPFIVTKDDDRMNNDVVSVPGP